jgi:hypothetical protein
MLEILREDRIWIRNQLKIGDEEVVRIFREVKKAQRMTDFNRDIQQLQIKLRKYLGALKNRSKLEEITKFK